MLYFENAQVRIDLTGSETACWSYTVKASNHTYAVAAPVFEVDGVSRSAVLSQIEVAAEPLRLANGALEYRYQGTFAAEPALALELVFRLADANPVLRFCYILKSTGAHHLTKSAGHDALTYLATSFAPFPQVKEVQFSAFVELVHSYNLAELPLEARHFDDEYAAMGPLLCASQPGGDTLLVAYEHGSQVPDAFLHFHLTPERAVSLCAVKGNYFNGQPLDAAHSYQTLWLQLAAVAGDEAELTQRYRTFVLRHQSLQAESRKPYIFYNTWAFQERNKWWYGHKYLDSMQEERILAEIEVAHRMGIDVFVLDTGWYIKTGDWQVNAARFTENLRTVKARLNEYGMKLGLWFDPQAAALSSRVARENGAYWMSRRGHIGNPWPIWETEESRYMCLVSPYAEVFADELIRLAREVGVTYFKWDAIGQYGCDDPGHQHGNADASEQERYECYGFELCRAMTRIVERVCEAVPEAIVDFDVTESHRAVGLAFLSAGKYFLINNGSYYWNFDVPIDDKQNPNLFFFPGQARTWICRTPLTFDKWLPSTLFLTHYLPDDPVSSQLLNVASLILGQNGIWGDLLQISEEGVSYIGELLARYKQVRDDITRSTLIRQGHVGGSPEIYEKLDPTNGRGVVVLFATSSGTYRYITQQKVADAYWHSSAAEIHIDEQGRAQVQVTLPKPGAWLIFFGM